MSTLNLQQELKEALLDEQFLSVFAAKLKKAFQEPVSEKKHPPEELEVFFNVSENDKNAFLVSAAQLYDEKPEILVFDHKGLAEKPPIPVKIDEKLYWLIVKELRLMEAENECVHWAGLRLKTPTASENSDGEVT